MNLTDPNPEFLDTGLIWQAWSDGTACPNPGRIGLGGLLVAPDGREFPLSQNHPQPGCNNEAEARALLATLDLALALGVSHLRIHSDSDVVVRLAQAPNSTEAARLAPLFEMLRQRLARFTWSELKWLPQQRNQRADQLARQALGLPPRQSPKPHKRRR
jgi:ribonuclease HI